MNNFFEQVAIDELSISTILLNLTVSVVLSIVLQFHFENFSSTLSGKKELSRIIPFLVLIVCLIISIVKSSLALSLGLVGALSIVRFRTPIKEPEELVYLFMCIAIGLGLGANQTGLTVIATLFILLAPRCSGRSNTAGYFVDIASHENVYDILDEIKSRYPHINSSFIYQSRIPGI